VRNIHSYAGHACRIDRARPLLGTIVKIGISGIDEADAYARCDRGFAAVAHIHELMSFHEFESDVSRLNRGASIAPVSIDRHTATVIRLALDIASASDGIFDITVAPKLVDWQLLPAPEGAPAPDPHATWRDIELVDSEHVRFHRPLWIDLGGIAKGYAVDVAIAAMKSDESMQLHVNAGGDLRVAGPDSERVLLQVPGHDARELPMIELAAGSIASSSRRETTQQVLDAGIGPHLHGVKRCAVGANEFASVLAERCVIADALTKVALAAGPDAAPILARFEAQAFLHDQRNGWRTFGYES